MQWEYMVRSYFHGISEDALMDELDGFGLEGWELISLRRGRMIFKRPLIHSDIRSKPDGDGS